MKKLLLFLLISFTAQAQVDTVLFCVPDNPYYEKFVNLDSRFTYSYPSAKYLGFSYYQMVNSKSVYRVKKLEYITMTKKQQLAHNVVVMSPENYYKKSTPDTHVVYVADYYRKSEAVKKKISDKGVIVPSKADFNSIYLIKEKDSFGKSDLITFDIFGLPKEMLTEYHISIDKGL